MTRKGFVGAAIAAIYAASSGLVAAVPAALGVRRGRTYWDWRELCEDMVFERQGGTFLAMNEPPEYAMFTSQLLEALRTRPWATAMRAEGDFIHIETWNCNVHYRIIEKLPTHDVVVARRDGPYEWTPPPGHLPVRNRFREVFAENFPGLTNAELDHLIRELT